jgi:hypothetical protein
VPGTSGQYTARWPSKPAPGRDGREAQASLPRPGLTNAIGEPPSLERRVREGHPEPPDVRESDAEMKRHAPDLQPARRRQSGDRRQQRGGHYEEFLGFDFTDEEEDDLVAFLKAL